MSERRASAKTARFAQRAPLSQGSGRWPGPPASGRESRWGETADTEKRRGTVVSFPRNPSSPRRGTTPNSLLPARPVRSLPAGRLRSLAGRDAELEADLLVHLGEVDARELYLGEGYPSPSLLHRGAPLLRVERLPPDHRFARRARLPPCAGRGAFRGAPPLGGAIARAAAHAREPGRARSSARATRASARSSRCSRTARRSPMYRRSCDGCPCRRPRSANVRGEFPRGAGGRRSRRRPPLTGTLSRSAPTASRSTFTAGDAREARRGAGAAAPRAPGRRPRQALRPRARGRCRASCAARSSRRASIRARARHRRLVRAGVARTSRAAIKRAVAERDLGRCTFVARLTAVAAARGGPEFHHLQPFARSHRHART